MNSSFFLSTSNTATNTVFDALVFWALGYGGWLGVALIPIIWAFPVPKVVRTLMSLLIVPTSALVITATFSAFYMFSQFLFQLSSIMISPQFIHSCICVVCLGVGSIGMYLANSKYLEMHMIASASVDLSPEHSDQDTNVDTDEVTDNDTNDDDTDEVTDNDTNDDDTDEVTDSYTNDDTDDVTDNDTDEQDNSWRKTANFDGLRNASPIPE